MQCFAMIKSGHIVLEEILGGHCVCVFAQILQDLLHCCGVEYMDSVFLCQAWNFWVTIEGKGTENSQHNQVTV